MVDAHEPDVIFDRRAGVVHWSPAAETLLRYPRSAVLGRTFEWVRRGCGITPDAVASELAQGGVWRRELVLPRADGQRLRVEVAVALEAPDRFAATLRDVTVHRCRQASAAVAAAWGDWLGGVSEPLVIVDDIGRIVLANAACVAAKGRPLEDLVGQPLQLRDHPTTVHCLRVGDAEYAVLALQPTRRVRRLRRGRQPDRVAILAHEIRGPLASVKLAVGLLRRRLESGTTLQGEAGLVRQLEDDVDRLAGLCGGILEAGPAGRRDQCVDVAQILIELCAWFRAEGTGHKLRAEIHADGDLPVLGDPVALPQVFRNLLDNAAKYAPAGSTVRLTAQRDGGRVRVVVSDEGCGIPAADLERVFDVYYRVRHEGPPDPGGSGLGLYICRSIVNAHGGSIWAGPAPGGGTALHVELPLCDRA